MQTSVTGTRSRPAWAGTAEDVRALADTLTDQLAPLRSTALAAAEAQAASWPPERWDQKLAETAAAWQVRATLTWTERTDQHENEGTVEEILDRAAELSHPPESLRLDVKGDRYVVRPLVSVLLHRYLGARVSAERGPQPQLGRLLDVVEQQLDRRQPGGAWLVQPRSILLVFTVPVLAAFALAYWLFPTKPLLHLTAVVAVNVAQFVGLRFFTPQDRRPGFELLSVGQRPALEQLQFKVLATLGSLAVAYVVGVIVNAMSERSP